VPLLVLLVFLRKKATVVRRMASFLSREIVLRLFRLVESTRFFVYRPLATVILVVA
jgi:hypothetical protein